MRMLKAKENKMIEMMNKLRRKIFISLSPITLNLILEY
jgi:hypothetical protein